MEVGDFMSILSINTFCQDISPALQFVGQALTIFKVSLPLVLICMGIIDIAKAVLSSKSDEVKKNLKSFFQKIAICVGLFFVPTLCMVVFGFVGGFNDIKNKSGIDYDVCYDCVFNPSSKGCRKAVQIADRLP